jgi:hypothetical protein
MPAKHPNPRRPRSGLVAVHARFTRAPSSDRHRVPLSVPIQVDSRAIFPRRPQPQSRIARAHISS